MTQNKEDQLDEDISLLAGALSAAAAGLYFEMNFLKTPQHTSLLRGRAWMDELLSGHPDRMKNNLGISQEGFVYLEQLLIEKGRLQSSRFMDSTERLGIFLYAVVSDLSMRKLAERFQRSTDTIHGAYHNVMKCFLSEEVHKLFIKSATESTPVHSKIEYSRQYNKYFDQCIGAIDGTHIPVSPPQNERAAWRNRKGKLTQNVLSVCNFDLEFTDLLCGWEGSTADSTLWIESQRSGAVRIPKGRYVLGDDGFANCDLVLTPYRGVRYHLREWERRNARPQNASELFNLRHAQLRNVVERIFGVLKNRFKILNLPRAFKMEAQIRVVAVLCLLHNILIKIGEITEEEIGNDEGEIAGGDEEDLSENTQTDRGGYRIGRGERTRAGARRDAIAKAMWEDYCNYYGRRR
jgi:DDE superfamily endonuclease